MEKTFQTIALVGKDQSAEAARTVHELSQFLFNLHCDVLVEQSTASAQGLPDGCSAAGYSRIGEQADLVLVVGGDGTLLGSARRLVEYGVPLLGVNQGRVGFLTDIPREEASTLLHEVIFGEFEEEKRLMLEGEVVRGGERVFQTLALNDIVLNKGESGRMIEFDLSIEGDFVYTQRSDGMIVATPTGSTAYALAANGPILHPRISGMALVPLCPAALGARPVTVPDNCAIELTVVFAHDARVHFDGQAHCDVRTADRVHIKRSMHALRLIHPRGYNYFAMLREKLHWSAPMRL